MFVCYVHTFRGQICGYRLDLDVPSDETSFMERLPMRVRTVERAQSVALLFFHFVYDMMLLNFTYISHVSF